MIVLFSVLIAPGSYPGTHEEITDSMAILISFREGGACSGRCESITPLRICALILMLGTASLAVAQSTGSDNAPEPDTHAVSQGTPSVAAAKDSTDAIPQVIQSVTVTSRKREEIDQQTPVSMTVLSTQSLDTHSIQSFNEIQYLTPGLRFEGSNNTQFGSLPNIRGQESSQQLLGIDPSVGIYVDGVYQTSTIGLNLQDMDGVERIEVLKGPQGTLYGRNTSGGAISITTRDPSERIESGIRLDLGNYDRHLLSGFISLPLLANRASFRLDGRWDDVGGLTTNLANNAEIADSHSKSLRGVFQLTPAPRLAMFVRGDFITARGGGPLFQPISLLAKSAATSEILAELALSSTNPVNAGTAAQQYLASGGLTPTLRAKTYNNPEDDYYTGGGGSITSILDLHPVTLKSISAYRNYSHNDAEDLDASTFKILSANNSQELNQFTQELQGVGDALHERLKYVAGFFYYQTSGKDASTSYSLSLINPVNPSLDLDHLGDQSYAGYAQLDYAAFRNLNFTAGVRETTETKALGTWNMSGISCGVPVSNRIAGECFGKFQKGNDNTSWSFGANYTGIKGVLLYTNTSRGFKSGGINERGTAAAGSFATFSPEIATNYEGGVKSDFLRNRARFNADYYYTDYTNIQRSASVSGPNNSVVSITTNAAKARINGGEAETSAIPFRNALLSAVGSLTEPKYLSFVDLLGNHTNQRFEGVPRWTYGLSGQYVAPLHFGNIASQVNWVWQSNVDLSPAALGYDAIPDHTQGAYGLLDARVTLELPKHEVDIAVYGKNLLDQRYFTSILDLSSSVGTSIGQIGMPRSAGVVINKHF